MKEFKFACPFCGQHITAAPGTSGAKIDCPTCFQKLTIPEFTGDTKLVITAAKASGPRPLPDYSDKPAIKRERSRSSLIVVAFILCAAVASAYVFRHQLTSVFRSHQRTNEQSVATNVVHSADRPAILSAWTTNASEIQIPDAPASGMLRGKPFASSRSTLQGGNLTLRQGKGSPPELAITVAFPAKHGEDLAGKSVFVSATQPPPVPRVALRWKNEEGKGETKSFKQGYLLKLSFGQVQGTRMPGKIYLSLPDNDLSFVAGNFDAEIRPPDAGRKPHPANAPAPVK